MILHSRYICPGANFYSYTGFDSAAHNIRVSTIATYLGPPRDAGYGSDFYEADLEDTYTKRFTGTCEWIFRRPEYSKWMQVDGADPLPALLVTSGPGGGKSVLMATVIKRLQAARDTDPKRPVFYFFFDNSDTNKNCAIAAAKSLLHQAFMYGRADIGDRFHNTEAKLDTAAVENSKKFSTMWELLVDYLTLVPGAILALDALDECNDFEPLLNKLLQSELRRSLSILLSGRQNVALECKDRTWNLCCLDIGVIEASPDIRAYLGSKRKGAFRPQLREETINAIVKKSDGMFLWANLVSQNLESVSQTDRIQAALHALPQDLNSAYDITLTRLLKDLRNRPELLTLAREALQWVVCSIRPLRPEELLAALQRNHMLDRSWLDLEHIELACGPLINNKMWGIQLLHFSTREYLTGPYLVDPARSEARQFHVDLREANARLSTACVEYIGSSMVKEVSILGRGSIFERPDCTAINSSQCIGLSKGINWEGREKVVNRGGVMKVLPFAHYAISYWMDHLITCTYVPDISDDLEAVSAFMRSRDTFLWLELYLLLVAPDDGLMKLNIDCHKLYQVTKERPSVLQSTWARTVLEILEEYGQGLIMRSKEVHHIDVSVLETFNAQILHWLPAEELGRRVPKVLNSDGFYGVPEQGAKLGSSSKRRAIHLHRIPHDSELRRKVAFMCYHQETGLLIFADHETLGAHTWLYCHDAKSGAPKSFIRTVPTQQVCYVSYYRVLLQGVTGKDMRYICLQYLETGIWSSVIVWRFDLREEKLNSPSWATRVLEINCTPKSP